MKTPSNPLLGIWGALERRFTIIGIAQVLGTTTPDVRDLARPGGPRQPTPGEAFTLTHLCLLHGISPVLYRYAHWADPRGVFIASLQDGTWTAWTLQNSFSRKSAWSGSEDEIKLCLPSEVEEAREHGWQTRSEDLCS